MRWTLLAGSIGLLGCHDGATPAEPDAAAPPDAPFHVTCPYGNAVSITGATPRGPVDALGYLHVTTSTGFCLPGVQVVFSAQEAWGFPAPLPRLEATFSLFDPPDPEPDDYPVTGTRPATVRLTDRDGEIEATGVFHADAIDSFGELGHGARGRLVVDDPGAGWSLDLAVDATYCHNTVCF